MKPNTISRMGYKKKLKSDRGYEIFGKILNLPSSPLPGMTASQVACIASP